MQNKTFFETPILFITFNRLDTTKKVFQKIKEQKPKKLYLASDAAREEKPDEEKKVLAVRSYLKRNIDWDCEVKMLYQTKNLGCKFGPHNAISWFFEHEEQGIILEDDCLPSNSFFCYCETMLNRYKDDLRIFTISGFNYNSEYSPKNQPYFYAKLPMIWGWATWRDRWLQNLKMIENFEIINKDPLSQSISNDSAVSKIIIDNAKLSIDNKVDVWDYLWLFTNYINNALSTFPSKNLIENIGYGTDATHTASKGSHKIIPAIEIDSDWKKSTIMLPYQKFDELLYKDLYNWKSLKEKITNPSHMLKVIKSRLN
ncbi:nucleotide-diphospho-sugar transferase [Maribacter sp. M208]|uniref:nucleotide-diphospho-sugar transferase n=1 Tax=Maribacter huludaoensis TaxID=3030010 RepID=UPI0023ECD83A|nr:nucleotide-diphospho-sugar transferase [Maribacter huludaoensis]MDF4222879.1 nucleotide-diphospho-sugar transferase [Maribacter huludaoensis]